MQRAWTLIGTSDNHWDVGPTFETREKAKEYREKKDYSFDKIQPVTCWIDDFDEVDWGVFLMRTDCSHEVTFVVAEESTEDTQYGNEALVGTRIKQ